MTKKKNIEKCEPTISASDKLSENIEKDEINEEIENLKLQINDLEDKFLRAVAEAQNVRKQADKEKIDTLKYGIAKFAKDILDVRDNLKLAIVAQNDDPIITGIKLTLSILDKVLTNNNIIMIDALEAEFDPHFHQAIMEREDNEKKPGTVIEVIQDGFMIWDRLLRPALVVISKNNDAQDL